MPDFQIYVLEPRGLNSPVVQDALALIQEVQGPVKVHWIDWLIPDPDHVEPFDDHAETKGKKLPAEFGEDMISSSLHESREEVLFNRKFRTPHRLANFQEDIFDLRDRMEKVADDFYATTGADRANSMVVMLTNVANPNNFFAVPDLFGKQCGFIQINHFVTHRMAAPHLPIAYELICMGIRHFAFSNLEVFLHHLHMESIGCMNDFYGRVEEMNRKLRSADICDTCLRRIREADVPFSVMRQLMEVFEKVRSYQLNLRNVLLEFTRPRITLGHHIRIEDTGAQVPLSPKEKAIYVLFASHPQGIPISHLPDYEEELFEVYSRYYTGTSGEDIQSSHLTIRTTVRRLCYNESGDLSQAISRINRKLVSVLGELVATNYQIQGPNGEAKRIAAAESHLEIII